VLKPLGQTLRRCSGTQDILCQDESGRNAFHSRRDLLYSSSTTSVPVRKMVASETAWSVRHLPGNTGLIVWFGSFPAPALWSTVDKESIHVDAQS
jgi:hypothetical protein